MPNQQQAIQYQGLRSISAPRKSVSYSRPTTYFYECENRTASVRNLNPYAEQTGGKIQCLTYPLSERLEKAFEYIGYLNDNWDSYGALALKEHVIAAAKSAASFFPEYLQPEVQPETDGAIGLYWDKEEVSYCIKILDTNHFEWFRETPTGDKLYGSTAVPMEQVAHALFKTLVESK